MKVNVKSNEIEITDFSAIESYKIACAIEKDGLGFYKELLSAEKNTEVRQTLEFLIDEEARHLEMFESKLEDLRMRQEEDFEDDDLFACIDYGIFEPYKNIENLADYLDDIKKALRLGINIEDKAISFYRACLKHTSSDEVKEELSKIIAEEINHRKLLENILGT